MLVMAEFDMACVLVCVFGGGRIDFDVACVLISMCRRWWTVMQRMC